MVVLKRLATMSATTFPQLAWGPLHHRHQNAITMANLVTKFHQDPLLLRLQFQTAEEEEEEEGVALGVEVGVAGPPTPRRHGRHLTASTAPLVG